MNTNTNHKEQTMTTETTTNAKAFFAAVHNADPDSPLSCLGQMLENRLWDVRQYEVDMTRQLDQIERDTNRARASLTEGHHMNTLGEFQSSAVRFDQMCGQRAEMWTEVRRLVFAINKITEFTIDANDVAEFTK
jgi:hypothetical protein